MLSDVQALCWDDEQPTQLLQQLVDAAYVPTLARKLSE